MKNYVYFQIDETINRVANHATAIRLMAVAKEAPETIHTQIIKNPTERHRNLDFFKCDANVCGCKNKVHDMAFIR